MRTICLALLAMSSAFAQYSRGVNVSGAEFGQMHLPGVMNTDYTFQSENTFRYFGGKNLTLIRFPIQWERIQQTPHGPLDPAYLAALKSAIGWSKAHGGQFIIDIHNFARYSINENGKLNTYVIDNPSGGVVKITGSDLADLWVKLSNEFKDEPGVYAYDLMNEPHDMGPADWKAISQAVLSAIRANGDNKLIMIPGNNWSAANTWPTIHGPISWISDPAGNFVYEAHQYFDRDNSGSYARTYDQELAANPNLATIGPTRLAPFVDWCRNNNVRGYLGEYGIPNTDPRWLTVVDNFLTALDAAGFDGTYWAAGEWWGAYPLSVQPQNSFTTDRVQMPVLQAHMPPLTFTTVSAGSLSGAISAPDSLVAGRGTNLDAASEIDITDAGGNVTTAPMIYISGTQINYRVPAGLTPGRFQVLVKSAAGDVLGQGNLELDRIAPALFALNGNGQGIAAANILRVKPDGTQTYELPARFDAAQNLWVADPVDFGSDRLFLVLYGTGFRNLAGLSAASLKIGGTNVPLAYAGAQPDFPGLDQANAELPQSLAGSGEIPIVFTVEGKPANTVTIAFR